jgi:molybdate transport system substrate-binding protein
MTIRRIAIVAALAISVAAFAPTASAGASSARSTVAAAAGAKPMPRQVSPLKGTINVYAAASLTEAFQSAAKVFHFLAPGVDINLSFAGSQAPVAGDQQGAAQNDSLGRVLILFLFSQLGFSQLGFSQLGQDILALHGFMRA